MLDLTKPARSSTPTSLVMVERFRCRRLARSLMVFEILTEEGEKVEYDIFFEVSRAAKKGVVNLYVQSAYVRDAEHASNRPKKKPISFFVILFNTLHNKPIKIQT